MATKYRKVILIFCASVYLSTIIDSAQARCSFTLSSSLSIQKPLLLKNGEILRSGNDLGNILMNDGDVIQFLCSGASNLVIIPGRSLGTQEDATCQNDAFVFRGGHRVAFASIGCLRHPESQTKVTTTRNPNLEYADIGFEPTSGRFVDVISTYFNTRALYTPWTKHYLTMPDYSCPVSDTVTFKSDLFGTVRPDKLYDIYNNATTQANRKLDRGHLSPKCDFLSGAEKRATFYYLNTAPQFSDFNRGNWRLLENRIRGSIRSRGSITRMVIYTGVGGTTQFYLGTTQIPVSLYFWKAVIHRTNQKGVIFIGVNDVQNNHPDLCPSVCDQLTWLQNFQEQRQRVAKGKVYCCSIETFRGVGGFTLPEFREYRSSAGLLKDI